MNDIMAKVQYESIGVVHSPFAEPKGTPIQPKGGKGITGTVEVSPQYVKGLKDLDGFSHIILVYHFHQSEGYSLRVKPYMDDKEHGVFATRAPSRPNPIGVSVVRLEKIEGNVLHVRDVDIIDGTPLLDIKPYVPEFDASEVPRIGWLEDRVKRLGETTDDGRFVRW
jgi:tRNA-Thr(GGU) m(6)t(6)A37 methyltransferase TsaA